MSTPRCWPSSMWLRLRDLALRATFSPESRAEYHRYLLTLAEALAREAAAQGAADPGEVVEARVIEPPLVPPGAEGG